MRGHCSRPIQHIDTVCTTRAPTLPCMQLHAHEPPGCRHSPRRRGRRQQQKAHPLTLTTRYSVERMVPLLQRCSMSLGFRMKWPAVGGMALMELRAAEAALHLLMLKHMSPLAHAKGEALPGWVQWGATPCLVLCTMQWHLGPTM